MVMRRNRQRVRGFPTSSNGASSMHVHWPLEPGATEVAVTLEVLEPPTTDHLHFWALQVSFVGAGGKRIGGAHLGLQWHPQHPGRTAVCWGGYRDDGSGRELDGGPSPLPSASGNPNTRDLTWRPVTPYRLRITAGGDGYVDDTFVRRLHVDGAVALAHAVVWSEVFAPCDAPSTAVRWSGIGSPAHLTYQSYADGGCTNVATSPDGAGAWIQRTNV